MESTTLGDLLTTVVEEEGNDVVIISSYVVPIVFALIFITGLIGNGLLVIIVLRNNALRASTPNIFIVSLALGDLALLLISVPFTATIYTFTNWPYGDVVCRLNEFMRTVSQGVSVFTLTALSGDRYLAIVDPMRTHRTMNPVRALIVVGTIWIWATALAIPDLAAFQARPFGNNLTTENGEDFIVCDPPKEGWSVYYVRIRVITHFLIYFAIPIIVITVFYSLMARILIVSVRGVASGETDPVMTSQLRSSMRANNRQLEGRKRVAWVVLSLVFIFVVCWLPRHVYLFWFNYGYGNYDTAWHIFKISGFCLSFINSCVNPFALYLLSHQFRRYFNRYLCCCCRRAHAPDFEQTNAHPLTSRVHVNCDRSVHSLTAAPSRLGNTSYATTEIDDRPATATTKC